MTKLAYIYIIGFIFFLASCSDENSGSGQNCFDCEPSEPSNSDLTIKVTINSENPSVPITVYNEKYNPDKQMVIVAQDTTTKGTYVIKLPVNTYYSVKAEYKSGEKIIYAVDGSIFNTQKQAACDNECWQMIGNILDATLKFK